MRFITNIPSGGGGGGGQGPPGPPGPGGPPGPPGPPGPDSGSSPNYVFADFGTQDPSQGRYTSWTDLMAELATIQLGAAPLVRLALQTGPFVVPLAGMPVNGWDFRGGTIGSFYGATGAVVLDVPDGVKFDMLYGIGELGGVNGSVVMKIDPALNTGVLEFSALPLGSAYIFSIGSGSAVDHSTNTGALMRSPGGFPPTTMVLALTAANQNVGLAPPLSGPLLELNGDDGAVGVQRISPGGLPDNWLVGGGPTSSLVSIYDINANPNTLNPAAWVPFFTGGGGVSYPFPLELSSLLFYDDFLVAPALGASNVQGAIDALKGASSPGFLSGAWLQAGLSLRDAVYSTPVADTLGLADRANLATILPFVGLISSIPAPNTARVTYAGEFPWGALGGPPLTPGAVYYLGAAGALTTTPPASPPDPSGTVLLRVGYAKSVTVLVLSPGEPVVLL